jgi:hypothetical protein
MRLATAIIVFVLSLIFDLVDKKIFLKDFLDLKLHKKYFSIKFFFVLIIFILIKFHEYHHV